MTSEMDSKMTEAVIEAYESGYSDGYMKGISVGLRAQRIMTEAGKSISDIAEFIDVLLKEVLAL